MKRLIIHALIIAGVMFGSDVYVNGGSETALLLHQLNPRVAWNQAQIQSYHATASVTRGAVAVRPQLTLANFD
ncbi:MAG TPA: hypothetical protein VGA77_15270 [Propylenella sp.]